MTTAQPVTLRASKAPCVVLWIFVCILVAPLLVVAFSEHRDAIERHDARVIAALLILAGLAMTALISRMRLTISADGISYRGVIRSGHVPRAGIARVRAEFSIGRRGPFILAVEPTPGESDGTLILPMKPFDKRGLSRFLQTAEELGIPTVVDELVAVWLGPTRTWKRNMNAEEVAQLIERFLANESLYPQEWNDFVDTPQQDPVINEYRKQCDELDPRVNRPGEQAPEAVARLREMIVRLRSGRVERQ